MYKYITFFKTHKKFTVLCGCILLLILVSILAPVLAPYDPGKMVLQDSQLKPSMEHLMGTDIYGRDIFSRILYGGKISIGITITLVVVVLVLGTIIGVIAGYYGGIVDVVLMRISDVMLAFPDLILALAIAGILGVGIWNAFFAILVVSWTKYARLARSITLKLKNKEFILAAKMTGTKTINILIKHIMPNVMPTAIVTAAMDIGTVMLAFASLSFLGFGIPIDIPEWGSMLNEGRTLMDSAPWLIFFPGLAIFITISIFNLFGDEVRDILDPKS